MPLQRDQGVEGLGGPYVPAHVGRVFVDAGYSGGSFNNGLLRFHDAESGPALREHVLAGFPELKRGKADVVAFDWHGRQVVALKQGFRREAKLVLADIGRGTVEDLADVSTFATGLLNDAVVDALFDQGPFEAWRAHAGEAGEALAFHDCVEFMVPVYLGGSESLENLNRVDMGVAWDLGVQIWSQVKDLPPGTQVTLGQTTATRT
jgi:hypothetical protein